MALNIGMAWRFILLFLAVSLTFALSYKQPWLPTLEHPEIQRISSVQMRSVSSSTLPSDVYDTRLPDQWRVGLATSPKKIYRMTFDHFSGDQELALFVPNAQDKVVARINRQELAAHAYPAGRDTWIWNRALLFRIANDFLIDGTNTVELEVSSEGSKRVALGQVYLGPLRLMDEKYSAFWRVKVGIPAVAMVLMLASGLSFLAYAPVGGQLFWIAALFNIMAGLSLCKWLVVSPPNAVHVWFALCTLFEYLALASMTLFMALYLKLERWLFVVLGLYCAPILLVALASVFAADMDAITALLELAEIAWAIGGLVLFAVCIWRYCLHDDLNELVILWGVMLMIVIGLRDSAVHLGVLSFTFGQQIPLGLAIVTLSMMFVFLRSALRYSNELDGYSMELGGRVGHHSREIRELVAKQAELQLMAIVGHLSQTYSHELRNPIGTCLVSGNLVLKQLGAEQKQERQEASRIIESSLYCSELMGQMLATEQGLFPEDTRVPLQMPDWLIENSEDLTTAIGCRLVIGVSAKVKILAQPRSLLQAVGTLLSGICGQFLHTGTISAFVNSTDSRAHLMFLFSRPVAANADSNQQRLRASMASAQSLLDVDNATFEILYNVDEMALACVVEVEIADSLSDTQYKAMC